MECKTALAQMTTDWTKAYGVSTDSRPTAVAIVPARYAAERVPEKVIVPLLGKRLVLHVYERAKHDLVRAQC